MRIAVGLLDTAVTAPPFTRKGSAWVHRAPDRRLFASDDDRRFFVERLARVFRPTDVDLLAWAPLVNDSHRLPRDGGGDRTVGSRPEGARASGGDA